VEQRKKLAQTEIGDILKLIKEGIEECIGNQRNLTKFLKNFFSEMDTDKSGTIDRNEFKKAMKNLKIPIGNDEVEYIFLVYDPNKNGLDYQEFLDLLSLG
jgi:Ca2+-binding EF-hand superfamily protein